jgi:predicted nucleotidyltransferase
MKVLDDLQLPPRLLAALQAARDRIVAEFDVDRMVLFGSIIEGTSDEESDVDLLVVLTQCPSLQRRDRLTDVILDINLEYDVNISELIVDRHTWDKGLPSILPIREKIYELIESPPGQRPRPQQKPELVLGPGDKVQLDDPFLTLLYAFHKAIQQARICVVIGYGYGDGDRHI